MFFSIANRSQLRLFRAAVPALQQADQQPLAVMTGVVNTGGIVRVFENADELLEAPMGREMLVAVKAVWDAVQSTEATLHDPLHTVHVGVPSGSRLGAAHQTTAPHL